MSEVIRIFIADDHKLVRMGIWAMMNTKPNIDVIGEASNGADAISQINKLNPDVVLLDLYMPDSIGIQTLCQILHINTDTRVLLITGFHDSNLIFEAIEAGASGCLFKDSSPDSLCIAIQAIFRGEIYLDPKIARLAIEKLNQPPLPAIPEQFESLSEREIDVLKLISQGYTNYEIAAELCITKRTVGSHVSTILSKLQVNNRTKAALQALQTGLVELEDCLQQVQL